MKLRYAHFPVWAFGSTLVALAWAPGCSTDSDGDDGNLGGGGSSAGAQNSSSGDGDVDVTSSIDATSGLDPTSGSSAGGAGGSDSGGDGDGDGQIVDMLPEGFIEAENGGGYKIVSTLEDLDLDEENNCKNILRVVVRDFLQSHIDFGEAKPAPWVAPGLHTDLVLPRLDKDTRKPEINPDRMPTDVIESFDEWYQTTEDVNQAYVMDMWLEPRGDLFVFDTAKFFPLEGEWNTFSEDDLQEDVMGTMRNFLFTTEIHTAFEFQGDETFSFRGDDDVWIFINRRLAVDLGGIHGEIAGEIDLAAQADELGLKKGEVYALDMFQAERNPNGSNFRIETSLDFKECGVLEGDIIR